MEIAFDRGSVHVRKQKWHRRSGSCRATIYRLACVVTPFYVISLGRKAL